MKLSTTKIFLALTAAATLAAAADAQVLKVGGVGSSALFQTATIEAYQLASAVEGSSPGYYVAKNSGQINDQRGDSNIVPQLGNLSVVWDNATKPTNVWYYLSVDSGVGNRAYFSVPRAQLGLVTPAVAPSDTVINPAFFGGALPVAIPAAVQTVINNSTFTAAFTDVRPEDALFATKRTNCGTSTTATLGCLGYGTSDANAGAFIKSGSVINGVASTATAQAVAFNIFGTDPITNQAIPSFETVPIGVAPIIFLVNRTTPNGLGTGVSATSGGTFTGFNYQASPVLLYTGLDCDTSAFGISGAPLVAVNSIEREPISGTMNTFEYTIMLPYWSQYSKENFWFSQEGLLSAPYQMPGPGQTQLGNWGALQPATNNPLSGGCPANGVNNGWAGGPQGKRIRAIGTGEEVNTVKATADSIGYAFFSYGNVSAIAASTNYGYLTYGEWAGGTNGALIPTDPINPSGKYNTPYTSGNLTYPGYGQLPTCCAQWPTQVPQTSPT